MYNMRTKSIQKQKKSKYPEVGSEKPLVSKSCFSYRINRLLISQSNLQASDCKSVLAVYMFCFQ